MPWNESNHMDERIKFVARLLDGENMSRMCHYPRQELLLARQTRFMEHQDYQAGSPA